MRNTKKAFTLVELIVVITILAILGTIAFISLQGYSAEARNAKRTSDLGNIQSAMSLKSVEGVSILSFATNSVVNTVGSATGTSIALAGSGAYNPTASNYVAGSPAYSVLNITEKDFKDPQDNSYVIAATTLRGGAYQLAATMEVDNTDTALVNGTYTARSTSTGSISSISSDGTILTVTASLANFYKKGDQIEVSGSGATTQTGVTITKVSKDGVNITVDSGTYAASHDLIALATAESTGLIGATVGSAGNSVIDGDTTNLAY